MLLEDILSRENMKAAFRQVKRNKGCAGIDNIEIDELQPILRDSWVFIKAELLGGSYRPQPVKRVEIPKPAGGTRKLGIPTVLDRLIQQAIGQQLVELYDDSFSESSFGYRPSRGAHLAVRQAQTYINQGYKSIVEIDLAKFFDTVNHDYLMHVLSKRIKDKRVLKLIRRYLEAGVQLDDIVKPNEKGTPQGGPISPILSNILLDELDKELEKRGHRFVRYADDICIFVKSARAGKRVLESIGRFLAMKLKLTVNTEKSGVSVPHKVKLLGFGFYWSKGDCRIRIHQESIKNITNKVREITRKTRSEALESRINKLNWLIGGWVNYFKLADCKSAMSKLDSWCRSKLRYCIWKTWKRVRTRIRELVKLGVEKSKAFQFACTRLGGWRICHSPILMFTLTKKYLEDELGYIGFESRYLK